MKIILDLCGGSGAWAKPYKDNGYEVITVTLPDNDVRTYHYNGKEPVYGILAACPCESFSNARRGHIVYNQSMDRDTGVSIVEACMRIIKECKPVFWALENPATGDLEKYLGKPQFTFQPYEFGDGWAKKTAIWGVFNKPVKQYTSKNRPEAIKGFM
ncbi:MAG: DNA cytosine methyltransferase [Staphylococcus sp.]|nr:DNA cytosine methyltransferase [Staphylococcus sp.]